MADLGTGIAEPFLYAHILFARSVRLRKDPTREEIALLLYAFMEWGRPTKTKRSGS